MDVNYELGDLKFVWDSEKAEKNFNDDEDRYKIIGKVREILTVIYTERGDRNRIISARQAGKRGDAIL